MAYNYLTEIDYSDGGDTFYEGMVTAEANFETIDNEIYDARGGETDLDTRLDGIDTTATTNATNLTNYAGLSRCKWGRTDDDTINYSRGVYPYETAAGSRQVAVIDDGTLDITCGASDWYYIYYDHSGTAVISATTEPTWDADRRGWYNGDDLCIFAVLTDGDSDILEFTHDGDFVKFHAMHNDFAQAAVSNAAWSTVTFTAPVFATYINVMNTCVYGATGGAYLKYRIPSDAGYEYINYISSATQHSFNPNIRVAIDSSQQGEIEFTAQTDNEAQVWNNGFWLPIGM